jgi:phosphoribosylformylglycinamidine synthase subunit PurQ / glutaminase
MKAGVVTFPDSNCDDDLRYTLEKVAGFETKMLWHKDSPSLADYDLICLPGGFSYGDYLRCGAMASLSPIMEKVKEFASNGGLVLGICNGFQILCEARLLPGALARNESLLFQCKDVPLKVESNSSPWTLEMKAGETLSYPIANGEGRFILGDEDFAKLSANGQILLTYVTNPNGSEHSIAGIANTQKNVFGLMPHPERASDLRSGDGMKLWASVTKFIKEKSA